MIAFALATLTVFPLPQDPGPGISQDLARARAERISDITYWIRFDLDRGMREVSGKVLINFSLADEQQPVEDVVLDFGGGDLDEIRINELQVDGGVRRVADHIILPAEALTSERNRFVATFTSPVAETGTPLSVYRDPVDGAEYYYTLVVPADAHRLYPCFDQPDLKGKYVIALATPTDWQTVSNGVRNLEEEDILLEVPRGKRGYLYLETQPISTYLMAFAAGPFQITAGPTLSGLGLSEPMRIYHRRSAAANLDRPTLIEQHARGLQWLQEYFGVAYPFEKLDFVLVPGFPYGGMEHAGAIFYRERAMVFDHPPTESELTRRSTLIYHELSHQWFGNLVTMRWFDDLWLKEGFATFIGYHCLQALEPNRRAWLRFHQRVKPRAYAVDATAGTTPVYQELQNLADAKSAYGAIVYNKAPAVLRELHERIGAGAFRTGVNRFLDQFAFDNATWQDLAAALDGAARQNLRPWSQRWILTPSMPRVRVSWSSGADGKVKELFIDQQAIDGSDLTWPLRLELLVWDHAGERSTITVNADAARTRVKALEERPEPACILVNPRDVAYGQFLLDTVSREFLLEKLPGESDVLVRAVALSALWDTVREAELDPARFAALAIELLAKEEDAESHAWLLSRLSTALHRYLSPARRAPLVERATTSLLDQLDAGMAGRALQTFRFLARVPGQPRVLELCRRVTRLEELPPGLTPGAQDRFLAMAALVAAGEEPGQLDLLQRTMAGEDTAKDRFLAAAAQPQADVKSEYFARYLKLGDPPEQWVQDSLSFFHWSGQSTLTLPYLRKALEQVEWVKQNRRIFFMPAWIDGFVNGHSSPEALEIVRKFMAERRLPNDIRLKLLQSLDSLERTVKIRERFE